MIDVHGVIVLCQTGDLRTSNIVIFGCKLTERLLDSAEFNSANCVRAHSTIIVYAVIEKANSRIRGKEMIEGF